MVRHSIRSGPQFMSLISLVTSCQLPYHTEIRCLSKPTFIRSTHCSHMTVTQTGTLLLFSNEIWVNLREYVHSKNNRYSVVNGTYMHYTPLHDVKVGVWCAMSAHFLSGTINSQQCYPHSENIFVHHKQFYALFRCKNNKRGNVVPSSARPMMHTI